MTPPYSPFACLRIQQSRLHQQYVYWGCVEMVLRRQLDVREWPLRRYAVLACLVSDTFKIFALYDRWRQHIWMTVKNDREGIRELTCFRFVPTFL